MSTTQIELAPPPREVPLSLRCELLTNRLVFLGAAFFALGSILTGLFLGNPIRDLRLAWDAQEVSGVLDGVSRTNASQGSGRGRAGKRSIYLYDYSFHSPDGALRHGSSYSTGGTAMPPSALKGSAVTVEYVQNHPDISRIKGMDTSVFGTFGLVALLFPAAGLGLLVYGVQNGRRKIGLLRSGELAMATITNVREWAGKGRPVRETPFEVFKERWRERANTDLPNRASPLRPAPRDVVPHPALVLFMRLWIGAVWAFRLFGIVFCLFALKSIVLESAPLRVGGSPVSRGLGTAFITGFLAIWLMITEVMLRLGRVMRPVVTGQAHPAKMAGGWKVPCTFEFHLPDGQVIRAKDTLRFTQKLADAPTVPVLYDPPNPECSFLLDGERLPIEPSLSGGWETTQGLRPFLRVALVAVALALSPVIGVSISR